MSRIAACFEALKKADQSALVTYITAGDPTPETTAQLLPTLADSGVDIIELGVPFSDPTADGPSIDAAHHRALTHNISLSDTLAMVAEFRQTNAHTPVVLMGYLNPIEAMGYSAFADAAAAAGVDGLIVVDLPPEEASALHALLRERGIDLIFLIAPTTTDARVRDIAARASGFLYYVSLKGTTGSGHLDVAAVSENIEHIRGLTDLPMAVGFGIRDGHSAQQLAETADGVVVGSALVERVNHEKDDKNRLHSAHTFVQELRQALNHVTNRTA